MEMLKELVEKVGMTAEDAWPHVVNHMWAKSLVALCVQGFCVVALFGVIIGLVRSLKRAMREEGLTLDKDAAAPPIIISVLCGIIIMLIIVFGCTQEIPTLLEPTGATIRMVIGR